MPESIRQRLQRGPATSRELQAATGLSQATVSRQLRAMDERLIRLKQGRSVHYALTRNAFGGNDRLPLYAIDPHGNTVAVACVRPLAHGGFFVEPLAGMSPLLLGQAGNGLYDDLPYFLDDLRPQGFLGRRIARDLSTRSADFPTDPRDWNTEHVGRYLLSNGDDLPGNLKFGQQAQLRVRRSPPVFSSEDYPALAAAVMAGAIPGSSAGGEQPKFTAYHARRGHVIVKFSALSDDPVARRWRDLLITEHCAAQAIRGQGIPAAETRLTEAGGRLFLESRRFDRVGVFGRMPLVSLQAVDAEFTGLGSNWPAVMRALRDIGLISPQDVADAEFLWAFGRLINNSDMHLGNLSLAFEGRGFRVLPVYDMCCMGFAPKSGEVTPYAYSPPAVDRVMAPGSRSSAAVEVVARRFWRLVAVDQRVSPDLRAFIQRAGLL